MSQPFQRTLDGISVPPDNEFLPEPEHFPELRVAISRAMTWGGPAMSWWSMEDPEPGRCRATESPHLPHGRRCVKASGHLSRRSPHQWEKSGG